MLLIQCDLLPHMAWAREGNLRSTGSAPVCLWQAALPAHGLCSEPDGCLGIVEGEGWSHLVVPLSPWEIPCELLSPGAWQMCWSWALCQQNPPSCPFQSVGRVWAGRARSLVPSSEQEGPALAGCGMCWHHQSCPKCLKVY